MKIPLNTFYEVLDTMKNKVAYLKELESCKVGSGARTIKITPDGRYVVAACNFSSCLVVVDTETMKTVARIKADSYPVGLDISNDGHYIYTTSQGRSGKGGNCVDIFKMEY